MRRLIDADKLKTDLEKAISKNEDMDCLNFFLRASSVIDAQPTDYDPDKVMEQLEELGGNFHAEKVENVYMHMMIFMKNMVAAKNV